MSFPMYCFYLLGFLVDTKSLPLPRILLCTFINKTRRTSNRTSNRRKKEYDKKNRRETMKRNANRKSIFRDINYIFLRFAYRSPLAALASNLAFLVSNNKPALLINYCYWYCFSFVVGDFSSCLRRWYIFSNFFFRSCNVFASMSSSLSSHRQFSNRCVHKLILFIHGIRDGLIINRFPIYHFN